MNWSNRQTVTVTGVDDAEIDGDVVYTIVTGAATSSDPAYNGLDALDVTVVNLDNDAPGLSIAPKGMLTVSEPNTALNLEVALTCQPAANVTVSISASDVTEGTVSPASRSRDSATARSSPLPHTSGTMTFTGAGGPLATMRSIRRSSSARSRSSPGRSTC